jgi:hypothetical protein
LIPDRLAELARALDLARQTDTVDVAVSRLLGTLQDRNRWLLIYDNAEQPRELAPFLPGGASHVLITSRYPDWQELATPVSVDVFDRDESVSLLRQRLPQLTEDEAGRVAEAVDNLPLALTQAAAYLQQTGLTAHAYLALLADRATAILTQSVPATYPVSLAASLQLAFGQLAAEESAALTLLRLAAQLAPEPIPFTLFTARPDRLPAPLAEAAGDTVAFARVTQLLRHRALARVGPDGLQVHRLVQAILGDRPINTSGEDDMTTVARRLLCATLAADPWDNPASWPAWRQLLPHVLAVTVTARGAELGSVDVPWLLGRAASYLRTRGEPGPARELFERAHQLYRDMLGEDHPDTLTASNNLAANLRALGEHEQARQLNEDTLTHRRRVLGDDHPFTLLSATSLAIDLRNLGEHQRARQLQEASLARCRRVLGDDHPDTLWSAGNLTVVLSELGEYERARQLQEDTRARYRRVLGDDHRATLVSATILVVVLSALGERERARELAEDTLARFRRVLGDDHPDTLRSATNLATVLNALGEHKRARELAEDTLARFRRVLGDGHPDTLRSATNLATVLSDLGEQEQARRL